MPQIIVPLEATGAGDSTAPTGQQYSARWTITGPDGTRVVFNDENDRDYIGMVTEVTGLDSPDVRENADDLVQMDGGVHGDFWYGRRPITLTGLLLNPSSVQERNLRETKLRRATNAMRGDATISWVLDGGYEQFVRVRRQQPLRITGGWQKQFQIAVVAEDPRLYAMELQQASLPSASVSANPGRDYPKTYNISYRLGANAGRLIVFNNGSEPTWPIFTITGPGTNPVIQNLTNGGQIALAYTLTTGEFLAIDTLNRNVMLNNESSRYGAIDFPNTTWFPLEPGRNDLNLGWTSFTTGSGLAVQWRDAWL